MTLLLDKMNEFTDGLLKFPGGGLESRGKLGEEVEDFRRKPKEDT
jgi:hypothetical protein